LIFLQARFGGLPSGSVMLSLIVSRSAARVYMCLIAMLSLGI